MLKKGDYILLGNYPQRRVYPYEDVYKKLNEYYTGKETEIECDGKKYAVVREPKYKRWPLTRRIQTYTWEYDEYIFFEYEPILWRVLDIVDEKALLFSEYVIDCKEYNFRKGWCTWHESSLRSWLNGYAASENKGGLDYTKSGFLHKAFSDDEKGLIINKEITIVSCENGDEKAMAGYENVLMKRNVGHEGWGYPEPDFSKLEKVLDDKIILLSTEEVYNPKYGFKPIEKRREFDLGKTAFPTEYALVHYANVYLLNDENTLSTDWFVRSFLEESIFPSLYPGFDVCNGNVSRCYNSEHDLFLHSGIRPALWIENKEYSPRIIDKESSKEHDNMYIGRLVTFGRFPLTEVDKYGGLHEELCSQNWGEKKELEYNNRKYSRIIRTKKVSKCSTEENESCVKDVEYTFFNHTSIIWKVIHIDKKGVLLWSKKVLNHKLLLDEDLTISQLKDWVNGYCCKKKSKDITAPRLSFYDVAFNEQEKDIIKKLKTLHETVQQLGVDLDMTTLNDNGLEQEDIDEIYGSDNRVFLMTDSDGCNKGIRPVIYVDRSAFSSMNFNVKDIRG